MAIVEAAAVGLLVVSTSVGKWLSAASEHIM